MCTLTIKLDILRKHLFHSDKIVVMALEFGKSVRGQRTVIYKNFEYLKIAKMYVGQLHGAASIKISFNARLELLLMRVEF